MNRKRDIRRALGSALLLAALLLSPVIAMATDLHPLGKPLPEGAIDFELQDPARRDREIVVEVRYQPWREGGVRKEWHLHLFDWIWRIGSRDKLQVKREETHVVLQTVRVTGSSAAFSLPLHAAEAGYEAYQLAWVRVGYLVFQRWFDGPPALAPEFGLQCAASTLEGTVRSGGILAAPLNGGLPLWPGLRTVRVNVAPVAQPDAKLWDPLDKHYWDGWRNSVPQEWPGGRTVVTRRVDGTAVWRSLAYSAYGAAGAPLPARPEPPSGVLPGAMLEVFWPKGDTLEFPDANVEQPGAALLLPVAALTERGREILARSVELRPGVEQHSVSAAEWQELEKLARKGVAAPVAFSLRKAAGQKDLLVAHRKKLVEPLLCLFGAAYDGNRRYSISALVLDPAPWSGPLPE